MAEQSRSRLSSRVPDSHIRVPVVEPFFMGHAERMQRGHRVKTFPTPPAFGDVHRNLISAQRGKGKCIKILCSVAVKQPPSQAHAAFEQLLPSQDCVRSSLFRQRCNIWQKQGHKHLEGRETSVESRKVTGVTGGNPVFMGAW